MMQRLETWVRGTCPSGVRFITAAVDVQAHKFRANFFGWGEGLQSWLIERVEISRSKRPEGDGFAGVEPGAYVEDWLILIDEVLERQFKVEGTDELLKPLKDAEIEVLFAMSRFYPIVNEARGQCKLKTVIVAKLNALNVRVFSS